MASPSADNDDQPLALRRPRRQAKRVSYYGNDNNNDDDDDNDNGAVTVTVAGRAVHAVTPPPKSKSRPKRRATEDTKDGDDDYYDDDMEEEEEDDDEEASYNDVPIPVPVTPSPVKKRQSATPKKKTPTPKKTPTNPTKKRSPPVKKKSRRASTTNKNKTNPRCIAIRGLPRGALAKCPQSGLIIRTLDGIDPLKKDAASSVDLLLPGKLLLVDTDHDHYKNLIGQSFDCAKKLQAATMRASKPRKKEDNELVDVMPLLATYDMEPLADPTFTSWEFAKARLESAGLVELPSDQDSTTGNDDSKDPIVVVIDWDGKANLTSSVLRYGDYVNTIGSNNKRPKSNTLLQWAIIENGEGNSGIPPVLVGAPESLVVSSSDQDIPIASTVSDTPSTVSSGEGSMNDITWIRGGSGKDLLPPPAKKVTNIRLPASLLEKAIRRGAGAKGGICTTAPLLDACESLLLSSPPEPGSTLAMLKAVWGCMLVDASPFDDADDCLGIPGLLLLSLVAKADPKWTMPMPLRRLAVTSALRTAAAGPSQWIGFVRRQDNWWQLEDTATRGSSQSAVFRNLLRAAQAAVGGRVAWGQWNKFIGDQSTSAAIAYLNTDWDGSLLPAAPRPGSDEKLVIDNWENKTPRKLPSETRLQNLDKECRLASIDPSIVPYSLVLLQAVLPRLPRHWKKHSLPSLSKHVQKLISNVNPRDQEAVHLTRLATWGKEKRTRTTAATAGTAEELTRKEVTSFRQIATTTGQLSEKETEVVDSYEAIQSVQMNYLDQPNANSGTSTTEGEMTSFPVPVRFQSGKPVSALEGRVAFLLAFASAVEFQVSADGGTTKEVVSAMFCGEPDEPLLVQRIGKARKAGNEMAGGSTSGATAVPSLGYVQRTRSDEEARLMEAAETEMAKYWEGGRTMPLPLPATGIQWELGAGREQDTIVDWQEAEKSVMRTAELVDDGNGKKSWHFTVGGVEVLPFDARAIVSSCAVDLDDGCIRPLPVDEGSEWTDMLRVALYMEENTSGNDAERVLHCMAKLHAFASSCRDSTQDRPSEGLIYNWLSLACKSPIPSRTWRDVLLAIRTRDQDHVLLGRGIGPDGTGTPGDMTEGVVLRLFHVLEANYPTVLKKEGAFKFLVRPRGAAFYHLLASLERLGRGQVEGNQASQKKVVVGQKRPATLVPPHENEKPTKRPRRSAANAADKKTEKSTMRPRPSAAIVTDEKISLENEKPTMRPRRSAAIASAKKTSLLFQSDTNKTSAECQTHGKEFEITADGPDSKDWKEEEEYNPVLEEEHLPVPKVTTTLWPHQDASVSKIVEGVQEGKRGHADASAVGAGKTLTALATVTRLAQWLETSGLSRHGVLIMLPTEALTKEWLLEIATHTEGFHIIEQRSDGMLFSLTYQKSNPPIDGNSIVISTLDRVSEHPFVRQSAWDFVVIDECLSVQNASAKRSPSAWRQIEVSTCGVLLLSATFFRSKYDSLFYMIRMLRSPLPRTMEWLPATIHEHIVCQIPETDRTWEMQSEMVPLPQKVLNWYRDLIDRHGRLQLNDPGKADGRKFWTDLGTFLREHYEGREKSGGYSDTSVMGDAVVKVSKRLLRQKRRPLIFADTDAEAKFLLRVLRKGGVEANTWSSIASKKIASTRKDSNTRTGVIVAVKGIEGQGINMQHDADCIVCRPTPGDLLEQMKGRVDRPGQTTKDLLLVVLVAEHTIEEAKFANIRLTGNFFRQYIAPVATKYRERVDLTAVMAAGRGGKGGGKKNLTKGTVAKTWMKTLEESGQSGAFARVDEDDSSPPSKKAAKSKSHKEEIDEDDNDDRTNEIENEDYKPRNKVKVNKADPIAVKQAKENARNGQASVAVRQWLFPPKVAKEKTVGEKPLPWKSFLRFSDTTPPLVLNRETVQKGVAHLIENDPKLAALLARVGVDALVNDISEPKDLSQGLFFDKLLRSITFTQVSVDAGEAFMRRLAIKIGVCWERKYKAAGSLNDRRRRELKPFLEGRSREVTFTHELLRPLVDECIAQKGEQGIVTVVAIANKSAPAKRAATAGPVADIAESGDYGPPLGEGKEYVSATMKKQKGNKVGLKLSEVDDTLVITSVEEGGLAAASALDAGMVLYSINGELVKGKSSTEAAGMLAKVRTGWPHICGKTHPCGKNDDPGVFLQKAREHAKGSGEEVSAGFSSPKAGFIISLVADFESRRVVGEEIATMSDRKVAELLIGKDQKNDKGIAGIGDWCAGGLLLHFLSRADILLYGDLTVRNYLNDLYNINHNDESETLLESAADFDDDGPNRNLIDAIAKKYNWGPYRSIVTLLMYHLQEENLILV